MNVFVIISLVLFAAVLIILTAGIHPAFAAITGITAIFCAIFGFGKMEEEGKLY